MHRAFAVDALISSHPLSSEADSIYLPEQISEQFDTIAYSKVRAATTQIRLQWDSMTECLIYSHLYVTPQGAAVLRMVSDFLSEPVFVQGLSVRDDGYW